MRGRGARPSRGRTHRDDLCPQPRRVPLAREQLPLKARCPCLGLVAAALRVPHGVDGGLRGRRGGSRPRG